MAYSAKTVAWSESWQFCWRCGKRGLWPSGLQIHHMVRGSYREKNNKITLCIACPDCHDQEHRGDGLGLIGWLVLKRRFDRLHFDLLGVCKARGRAATAITIAEVDEKERTMKDQT